MYSARIVTPASERTLVPKFRKGLAGLRQYSSSTHGSSRRNSIQDPGRRGREPESSFEALQKLRLEYLDTNGSTVAREILSEGDIDLQRAKGLFRSLVRTRKFTSPALILQCDRCGHREELGRWEDRDRCPVVAHDLRRCRGLLWPPSEVFGGFDQLSRMSRMSRWSTTTQLVLDSFDRGWPETRTKELLKKTGLPRSTLHKHLVILKENGQIVSLRHGHWKLVSPQP